MDELMEEYGGVILAMIGSLLVLGLFAAALFGPFSDMVLDYISAFYE